MVIALASTLKPIDDTRMYEKFAHTLSSKYDQVHVIGRRASIPASHRPNISFHPLGNIEKGRMSSWRKVKPLLHRIHPDIVIIHTVELLPIALRYCLARRIPLYYDVQENYARNFWYQRVYPLHIRLVLAPAVRLLEWLTSPLIKGYFLAESCYAEELAFTQSKSVILENRAALPPSLSPQPITTPIRLQPSIKMLYMGTISEVYGIRDAIKWCAKAQEFMPLTLTVVGYCGTKDLRDWLYEQEKRYYWLELEGIDRLVPHQRILQAIQAHDLVLLPYRPNASTNRCIPTKLYECLLLGKPMLIQNNELWAEKTAPYRAAAFTNFADSPTLELIEQLTNQDFYPQGPSPYAYWEGERLLKWIANQEQ